MRRLRVTLILFCSEDALEICFQKKEKTERQLYIFFTICTIASGKETQFLYNNCNLLKSDLFMKKIMARPIKTNLGFRCSYYRRAADFIEGEGTPRLIND